MTALRKIGLGAIGLLLLAACSNEQLGDAPRFGEAKQLVAKLTKREAAPAPLRLSGAAVAQSPIPLIGVQVEKDGRSTILARIAQNGATETYSTADKMTVSLREGVVVATRGFGSDLMSSQAPSASQIARGAGNYQRSYQTLDGADKGENLIVDCRPSATGRERVVVASREITADRVREDCSAGNVMISNDYWVSGSGRIVMSRQWISPESGFLRVERP